MSPSCQIRHTPLVSLLTVILGPLFQISINSGKLQHLKILGGVRKVFFLTVHLQNFLGRFFLKVPKKCRGQYLT